jgi:hypothetical protein
MTSANIKRVSRHISQRLSYSACSPDSSCTSTCTEPARLDWTPGAAHDHIATLATDLDSNPQNDLGTAVWGALGNADGLIASPTVSSAHSICALAPSVTPVSSTSVL